jgi:hypothetical protein
MLKSLTQLFIHSSIGITGRLFLWVLFFRLPTCGFSQWSKRSLTWQLLFRTLHKARRLSRLVCDLFEICVLFVSREKKHNPTGCSYAGAMSAWFRVVGLLFFFSPLFSQDVF